MTIDLARTDSGILRGSVERGGVVAFRGVPFAAPPIGERRFAPPAPPEKWDGERAAVRFGPSSIQNVDPLSMVMPGAERNYYSPATAVFDEDCLYANIFTPGVDDHARPVLVWIHGGGFITGSGSAEWYDGTNLASKNDVVVVAINYRLGILGQLFLGDVDESATNHGLRDMIAALVWVRANIAAFGGDPGNVTIFGQSAGGMAVSALVVSPLAQGLFNRAIVQSGNVDNFVAVPDALTIRQGVLDALRISSGNLLEQLRDVSTLRLLDVQRTVQPHMFPVADGVSVPVESLGAIRAGKAANVPLLIGNTGAENKLFHLISLPRPKPGFVLERGLEALLGGGSAELAVQGAALYREGSTRTDADLWDLATSDAGWVLASRRMADAHAGAGRPTYMFDFAIESTALDGVVGAAHEVDVPFVFDALDKLGVEELLGTELVADPEARTLAERVAAAWSSFARDGVPTLASIEAWPRYEVDRRATVILDKTQSIAIEHDGAKLDFWQDHGPDHALLVALSVVPE